jgi:hypothetical protein
MFALLCFVLAVLASPFKSKSLLEAENAALRHQLMVLRRKVPGRNRVINSDRWFLVQLYRWFPSTLPVLTIIRPETLERWHRAGLRCYCVGSHAHWEGGRRSRRTSARCRTTDLIHAARVRGSFRRVGLGASAPSLAILCPLD